MIVINDTRAKMPTLRGLWKAVCLRIHLADGVPPRDLFRGRMICRRRLKIP